MYRSKNKPIHAFTLLEIMLVVMIIAILAGAAIKYFGDGPTTTAKIVTAGTNAQGLKAALIQYQTLCGMLPTTEQGLAALAIKPTIEPIPKRWHEFMEGVPLDPWQNAFIYRMPGIRKPKSYDIFSAGPDGKPDTEDDVYPD